MHQGRWRKEAAHQRSRRTALPLEVHGTQEQQLLGFFVKSFQVLDGVTGHCRHVFLAE